MNSRTIPEKEIRVLIIDDEAIACSLLEWMLKQDPEIKVLGTCSDGKTALKAIREKGPDLIFLDVQMPGIDGFSLLKELSEEEKPYLIFVTAHDQYALRAFEVQAIDYLLKPFNQKRFRKALNRAKEQIFGKKQLAILQSPSPESTLETRRASILRRLEVRSSGRFFFIPVHEIHWIQAANQYIDVQCAGKSYLVRVSLGWVEKRLDPQDFVRVHRSVIVNINYVKEAVLDQQKGRYVILSDGTKLKVSRRRAAALRLRVLTSARLRQAK